MALQRSWRAITSTTPSTAPIRAADARQGVAEDPASYGLPSVATQAKGDRRAGVIWHTQGSGKSLLMAFYAGRLVKHPALENPTLVVLTDRNDLDDQLFGTFSMCRDLIRQTPVQAESREDLQKLLARASGGVIFTTLQKFGETAGPLTTRRNVVVIANEAHRSQYGFRAKVDAKTGEVSYGFGESIDITALRSPCRLGEMQGKRHTHGNQCADRQPEGCQVRAQRCRSRRRTDGAPQIVE